MRTILSDLSACGLPRFTFAGFQWPRHVARLQTGTLAQRLHSRKTGCTGEYYHAPIPGANKGRGFYLESDNAFGLRYRYARNDERREIRGIVLILPRSRGFLAGFTMGLQMASGFDPEIYSDETEAARAADSLAESVAESEREDSERFDAMSKAEIDADDACQSLRDAWGSYKAARVAWLAIPGRFADALESARDAVTEALQGLRDARDTLADATAAYERVNTMATFDRFDICAAYLALENDWNHGGWLRERPSNRRRMESTGVQLHRMGFRPAVDSCCPFETLQNDNQREIYCDALQRFGLALSADDETHAPILAFMGAVQ